MTRTFVQNAGIHRLSRVPDRCVGQDDQQLAELDEYIKILTRKRLNINSQLRRARDAKMQIIQRRQLTDTVVIPLQDEP